MHFTNANVKLEFFVATKILSIFINIHANQTILTNNKPF